MSRRVSPFRPTVTGLALAGVLVSRVGLAAGVSPTDATPAQRAEASGHLAAGKRALAAEDWDRATTELRASLDVVDSPNTRLQLARALRNSSHLADAWTEYGRVIQSATSLAATEARYAKTAEAATSERGEVEGKLAFVTVTVTNAPATARLSVGGQEVPQGQWGAIIASPGTVDVVLTDTAGLELARETVHAATGEKTPVALDGRPAAAPPPRTASAQSDVDRRELEPAPAPVVVPDADRVSLRPYAYVAGGVGVAGLVTFAVFGLMSNATYNDLQSVCHPGCPPGKQSEIDTGRSQQTIEDIALGVGLVGLATGATLWLVGRPSTPSSTAASLVVAPGYLGLRGSL